MTPRQLKPRSLESSGDDHNVATGTTPTRKHQIVGLFAGIGGLERGLARAGHATTLLCENDPVATSVLEDRFPTAELHGDVRTLERIPAGTTLIAGGFPCQDLSQAGRTAGIDGTRSGLVGEVFRLAKKFDTPWLLLENVPFMLQLSSGRAMHVVTSELEELGYKWAYRVVDSRAFGLPQRRRRVYILASRSEDPRKVLFADNVEPRADSSNFRDVACGFYWTEGIRGLGWAVNAIPTIKGGSALGIPSAPAIVFPDGRVGTPSIQDAERLQGFPANWTKPAEKVARASSRWKLVGNAVSVRSAEWLGRRLASPGPILDLPLSRLADRSSWPEAAWNVGDGRVQVHASEWPIERKYLSLSEFLIHPTKPLSAKATAGFLSRAERGGLRFPPDFLRVLHAHLKTVLESAELQKLQKLAA